MKKSIKIFTLFTLGLLACEDPETPKPVPATEPSDYNAKFLFVNATPDAPALDLYINNEKTGLSVAGGEGQPAYTEVDITSSAVIANTNIRTRATSGSIGGTLGGNDLIYRAGNNNANNFSAIAGTSYTLFAVDSINRPQPKRTLNAKNVGDITYFSYRDTFTAPKLVAPAGDTTIYLNVQNFGTDNTPSATNASANSITAFNLVKKYNGNVNPTFMTPVGVVPLGSSDVGGIRYYLWPDVKTTFTVPQSTTRAAFRVLNASPNSSALRIRLKYVSGPGAGDIIVNATGVQFIMSNAGGFTPSVGSRTQAAAASFAVNGTADIAAGGTSNTYDIEVLNAGGTVLATKTNVTFTPSIHYTFVISGFVGGTGTEALKVTEVEHIL
jgi:hypothetical protein